MNDNSLLLTIRGRQLVEKVDSFCKMAVAAARAKGMSVGDQVPSETISDLSAYLNYMMDSDSEAVIAVAGVWCRFRFSMSGRSIYTAFVDASDDGRESLLLTVSERLFVYDGESCLDYALAA